MPKGSPRFVRARFDKGAAGVHTDAAGFDAEASGGDEVPAGAQHLYLSRLGGEGVDDLAQGLFVHRSPRFRPRASWAARSAAVAAV